jgi:hypothetical protein
LKRILLEDVIRGVSKRWDEQYRNTKDEDKISIGNLLRVPGGLSKFQIDTVIGNESWTRLACNVCNQDCKMVVDLEDRDDSDVSASVRICFYCLVKGLEIYNGARDVRGESQEVQEG